MVLSIVRAIADVFRDGEVDMSPDQFSASPDVVAADADLSAAAVEVSSLLRERENVLNLVQNGSADGEFGKALNERFNSISAQVEEAKSRAAAAKSLLSQAKAVESTRRAARSVTDVLWFVEALRDPHSLDARSFLRRSVETMEFLVVPAGPGARCVSWTGVLLLSVGDQTLSVPFSGSETVSGGKGYSLESVVTQLLDARPLGDDWSSSRRSGQHRLKIDTAALAGALVVDHADVWMAHVGDSLLLRVYLALFSGHSDSPSLNSLRPLLGDEHGDADSVIAAVQRTRDGRFASTKPKWSVARSRRETECLIDVARNGYTHSSPLSSLGKAARDWARLEWAPVDGGFRVESCTFCSGSVLVRMCIDEPYGYVCLAPTCRRDLNGVVWPAERFDRFIAFPELWTAAGFDLVLSEVEPVFPRQRREYSRRADRLAALTDAQVTAILDDYTGRLPLRAIVNKHGLKDAHDVYALVTAAGVPLLRFPERQAG